jgi:hypothetical protein
MLTGKGFGLVEGLPCQASLEFKGSITAINIGKSPNDSSLAIEFGARLSERGRDF